MNRSIALLMAILSVTPAWVGVVDAVCQCNASPTASADEPVCCCCCCDGLEGGDTCCCIPDETSQPPADSEPPTHDVPVPNTAFALALTTAAPEVPAHAALLTAAPVVDAPVAPAAPESARWCDLDKPSPARARATTQVWRL